MALLSEFINIMLHLDSYLTGIVDQFGILTYAILFLVIFLETGIVITPFLPGDSLIFVAGTLTSSTVLDVYLLFFILSAAAIIGDNVNYSIGKYFGAKISKSKFVKPQHLKKTQDFYKKHGGKTIILARFLPIVRTFAPFIAGIGKMDYVRFLSFNVVGAMIWVALFVFGGFYFGNIPVIKDNLTIFILLIIGASIVPPIFGFFQSKSKKKQ